MRFEALVYRSTCEGGEEEGEGKGKEKEKKKKIAKIICCAWSARVWKLSTVIIVPLNWIELNWVELNWIELNSIKRSLFMVHHGYTIRMDRGLHVSRIMRCKIHFHEAMEPMAETNETKKINPALIDEASRNKRIPADSCALSVQWNFKLTWNWTFCCCY